MVNRDRNIFGSLLLKLGLGDAMITGVTRTYAQTMREVRRVIDHAEGKTPFGMHIWVGQQQTIFIADSNVTERPSAEIRADIAESTAQVAPHMGDADRVALPSFLTFGNPRGQEPRHQ